MQANIEIQNISVSGHYDLVYSLMQGLHDSEQEMFDKAASWTDIGKNYMQHVIDMQQEQEGAFLIAYTAGVPAGFIFGYLEEQGDERIEIYKGKYLYISDGYIKPAFRRMGIYKKLNTAIEQIYMKQGIRRITRMTLASNTRMRGFLEKENYQPVRMVYEKWLDENGNNISPLQLNPPGE